jgi:hypothetical protein
MNKDLVTAFDAIAESMVQAAKERSFTVASAEAQRHGLTKQSDEKPAPVSVWERTDGDLTLRFRWRWYDQSGPFSIQPDMNVLSLEFRRGDEILRRAEQRYEG